MPTLTLSFTLPDDLQAADMACHAQTAFMGIADALAVIRAHRKHEAYSADEALDRISEILNEAQGVLT